LSAVAGDSANHDPAAGFRFDEDLYTPFYGGRQFSIRDLNGLSIIFWQPDWLVASGHPAAR
jgi:hypothetical protein